MPSGAAPPEPAGASPWVSVRGRGEPRQETIPPSAPADRFPPAGVPETAPVKTTLPPPKVVDRWNEKRSLFGVYDNIGILGTNRP